MEEGPNVLETCRCVAQYLLSRNHFQLDSRNEFTVAVRGSFVREARRAFLRCRQAMFQFLVLCPSRLPRDVCKLICVPLLRTWLDDCSWFLQRDASVDLTVALFYDSPKGLSFYHTNYLSCVIVQYLKEKGSTFRETHSYDRNTLILEDRVHGWTLIEFVWGHEDVGALQMRGARFEGGGLELMDRVLMK